MPDTIWTRRRALAAMCGTLAVCGCRSAPVTGRKQLLLVGEESETQLGATAYQEVVSKETPSQNKQYIDLVNRVGQRIAAVAGKSEYQWEFRVIASPQQNAFCLPGGKVAVYEGIIPVCENEAGFAVVMSHEIAHALARHGGERMSQGYAVDAAKQAVSYVTQSQDQAKKEALLKAYGMASQYGVILPYSRKHESEADHIGLMLMSKAGYEPEEAPRFWTRFGNLNKGEQPMEFLSTHPSDQRRAQDLAALMGEAKQQYAAASVKYGIGEVIAAAPTPSSGPAPVVAPAGATVPTAAGGAPQAFGAGPGPAAPNASIFGPPIR